MRKKTKPVIGKLYHKDGLAIFNETSLVKDVIPYLTDNPIKHTEYLYIVHTNGHLKGVVKFSNIFSSSQNMLLSDLVEENFPTVVPSTSIGKIANIAIQKKVLAVTVIDENGKFLGAYTSDILLKILRKEHIEDLHRMAGIKRENNIATEALSSAPSRRAAHRLPWLFVGVAGSLIATFLMSQYEEVLTTQITLSFFIPGIVYLADAVGTQTEAIAVRGLSLSDQPFKKIFLNEIFTGLIIGLCLLVVCFPLISIFYDQKIAWAVCLSLLFASACASAIGIFFPWILSQFKMDPASGSGPLATIIQDILTIFIYFIISSWLIL